MAARGPQATAQAWQRLMTCQTDLLLPAELPFYTRCEHWAEARSVLDIGTGNGYYLSRLAAYFPEKSYTGVDVSEAHIAAARRAGPNGRNPNRPEIDFIESDFFEYSGRFDVAIARLCVQHLNSLDGFLEHLRAVVRPGGAVIVVESCDEDRTFLPDMDGIRGFFRALREDRKANGYDRDAGRALERGAAAAGFRQSQRARVTSSSDAPGFKDLFFDTYMTVLELVEHDFGIEFDYPGLRREFAAWRGDPGAYTHLSVEMSCYEAR